MSELYGLFDRDVFVKLIVCDLWVETLEVLGITHPFRLASASLRGCSRPINRFEIEAAVKERALESATKVIAKTPVIPFEWSVPAETTNFYRSTLHVGNIDSGEAILTSISLTLEKKNVLITGDKRFIESMRRDFRVEFEEISPRPISLENCLLACMEHFGYDYVFSKVEPVQNCDGTLSIACKSAIRGGQAEFKKALESYNQLIT